VSALGVVVGEIITDFQARFTQAAEAAAVEQFDLEATPKRFGVRVAVELPRRLMLCRAPWRPTKALTLAAEYWLPWSEWTTSLIGGSQYSTRVRRKASLTRSSGIRAHPTPPPCGSSGRARWPGRANRRPAKANTCCHSPRPDSGPWARAGQTTDSPPRYPAGRRRWCVDVAGEC
jgi:hypothetical protein